MTDIRSGYRALAGQSDHSVLLVDDDVDFCDELRTYLQRHGQTVETAYDMAGAAMLVERRNFDIVLIDLLLGRDNGFDLLRKLRKNRDTPCLIITGKDDVTDKIVGLELGADDYMFKPLNFRELLARMRALLRRAAKSTAGEAIAHRTQPHSTSGWRFDPTRRNLAAPDGGVVSLTSAECDLLCVLVSHAGSPQTRHELCLKVFQRQWHPNDRSLDGVIVNLRRKLEPDPSHPFVIQSVRGKGYVFTGFPSEGAVATRGN